MDRRSTSRRRTLSSAPSRYSLTPVSVQCALTPGRGSLPPVPKQTIQSDGANFDCLVVLAIALAASANSRQMKACAAHVDALVFAATSVVCRASNNRATASTSVISFRTCDANRRRSKPTFASKSACAVDSVKLNGPLWAFAVRRSRTETHNCR